MQPLESRSRCHPKTLGKASSELLPWNAPAEAQTLASKNLHILLRFLVVIAALATLLESSFAQPAATQPTTGPSDPFEADVFVAESGFKLPYRLLKPIAPKPDVRYPLVLFLHGSGECGDDNSKQVIGNVRKLFGRDESRQMFPCYMILPQCPAEGSWTNGKYWTRDHAQPAEPSKPAAAVLALVESMLRNPAIDSDRVYVFGNSMGGYGTWEMISRRPDLFAAAMPICGGGDEAQAVKIANVPTWAFHGELDESVPVARSRDMIKALKDAGAKPRYNEYPGVGHKVWSKAMSEGDFLPWMFAQKRSARPLTSTRPTTTPTTKPSPIPPN